MGKLFSCHSIKSSFLNPALSDFKGVTTERQLTWRQHSKPKWRRRQSHDAPSGSQVQVVISKLFCLGRCCLQVWGSAETCSHPASPNFNSKSSEVLLRLTPTLGTIHTPFGTPNSLCSKQLRISKQNVPLLPYLSKILNP